MTPTHDAAKAGDLAEVKRLIEHDHTLMELEDRCAGTPLMNAAEEGHLEVVRYLLGKGARISQRSHWGMTALWWACVGGHVDVVSLLLERGTDASAVAGGPSPLRAASAQGHVEVVQLLLRHAAGHGIDVRGNWTSTALWYASRSGHDGVVAVLLEAGADPSACEGSAPMQIAMLRNHHGCVELLQAWEVAYRVTKARRIQDAAMKIRTCPPANNAPSPEQAKVARLGAAAEYMKGRVEGGGELAVVEVRGAEGALEHEQEGRQLSLMELVIGHIMHDLKGELAVELRAYM